MTKISKGALVVGGGSGLGFAGAAKLAAEGWKVFLSGRRRAVLEDAASKLPPSSVAGFLEGDGTSLASMEKVCAAANEAMNGVDALVVSAGLGAIGSVEDITPEELIRVLNGNVTPVALACRSVLPFMPDGGAILAIASVAATVAHERRLAYSTAKAAVLGMVLQMALDLAPRRIRVNALSPSLVLTDLSKGALGQEEDPQAAIDSRLARHPLGRLGNAEEMGEAIAFLVSDSSPWITGQNIVVDGGMSL